MRVLIVEDDELKRTQLILFLREQYSEFSIDIAKSLHSGLRRILQKNLDLVLLDMTMPTFDIGPAEPGGRPQAYGGREILRQLHRHNIRMPVIVVTQFERFGEDKSSLTRAELDKELCETHRPNYRGLVYYNATTMEEWRKSLASLIDAVLGGGT